MQKLSDFMLGTAVLLLNDFQDGKPSALEAGGVQDPSA